MCVFFNFSCGKCFFKVKNIFRKMNLKFQFLGPNRKFNNFREVPLWNVPDASAEKWDDASGIVEKVRNMGIYATSKRHSQHVQSNVSGNFECQGYGKDLDFVLYKLIFIFKLKNKMILLLKVLLIFLLKTNFNILAWSIRVTS